MRPGRVCNSIAAVALALVALSLLPGASPAFGSIPKSTIDRIDSYVDNELQSNGVPGASLAIVDRDRTVHVRAFGETGRGDQPVEARTPFITCSVSKSFTALAVMQLVEGGKVDLDAPVGRYLGGFELAPASRSDQVTVRTLLNQTSGLATTAGGAEMRYLDQKSIRDTAMTLNGEELQGPPGTEFRYSNANYVLLGAVIEEVSGESYQDYVRRNIFAHYG
ncbi:MAG: beta-lactamase family protein [Solirubrobacterales bacterium]|nr:beta-lactamase family protein [Solirubrobacterales bacterium]